MNYRGFDISFSPKLGVWIAARYGVTMNHKDHDALCRMIDRKRFEEMLATAKIGGTI